VGVRGAKLDYERGLIRRFPPLLREYLLYHTPFSWEVEVIWQWLRMGLPERNILLQLFSRQRAQTRRKYGPAHPCADPDYLPVGLGPA